MRIVVERSFAEGILKLPEGLRQEAAEALVTYLATGETPKGMSPPAEAYLSLMTPAIAEDTARLEETEAALEEYRTAEEERKEQCSMAGRASGAARRERLQQTNAVQTPLRTPFERRCERRSNAVQGSESVSTGITNQANRTTGNSNTKYTSNYYRPSILEEIELDSNSISNSIPTVDKKLLSNSTDIPALLEERDLKEKKEVQEKETETGERSLEWFLDLHPEVIRDTCDSRLLDVDWEKLEAGYSGSAWLKGKGFAKALSWIVKNHEKIEGGCYMDTPTKEAPAEDTWNGDPTTFLT